MRTLSSQFFPVFSRATAKKKVLQCVCCWISYRCYYLFAWKAFFLKLNPELSNSPLQRVLVMIYDLNYFNWREQYMNVVWTHSRFTDWSTTIMYTFVNLINSSYSLNNSLRISPDPPPSALTRIINRWNIWLNNFDARMKPQILAGIEALSILLSVKNSRSAAFWLKPLTLVSTRAPLASIEA